MHPTNNNNTLTPLEKLIFEREQITKQCRKQEEKLNGHVVYLQQNAGSLLLSGLSSLLFPKTSAVPVKSATVQPSSGNQTMTLGISDYLSIAKEMMPVLWDVAKPLLVSWGVKKARTVFLGFFRKK